MKRYEQVSGLVKEVFTQKSFYREKPLRTKTFTQRVHRKVFTHRNFDAQMPLWRAETFTQRNLYTTFTQKSTQAHLHTKAFAHRNFYKHFFPQRSLYTEEFSPTNAFTHEAFTDKKCTEKLLRFPPLRFHLSTSAFQSVHIVRNLTSKLPSVKYTPNLHDQTQALSFHSASSSLGTL